MLRSESSASALRFLNGHVGAVAFASRARENTEKPKFLGRQSEPVIGAPVTQDSLGLCLAQRLSGTALQRWLLYLLVG